MKKFLILLTLVLLFGIPAHCADWIEIFEKTYIDISSIELNHSKNIIKFWIKSLRKDPKDTMPNFEGKEMPYWYSINKIAIDCNNKKSRVEVIAVYGLKGDLIYSDEYIPDWNTIIPDTYFDGYYRLLCSVPFTQNPLLKGGN